VIDSKLHTHTETALKRREPTILKLSKTYNDLCRQMATLIQQGKAPHGAIKPLEIARDRLFLLDVDDEIWQDVGLHDGSGGAPPLWLSDEKVRLGITKLLEHDRCKEEEIRLIRERRALQEWMREEWAVNAKAHQLAGKSLLSTIGISC
jgi:hypothetical protein